MLWGGTSQMRHLVQEGIAVPLFTNFEFRESGDGNAVYLVPVGWVVPVWLGVTGVVGSVLSSPEQSFWKLTSFAVTHFSGWRKKVVVYSLVPQTIVEMWTDVTLHLSSGVNWFVTWTNCVLPGVPRYSWEKLDVLCILTTICSRQFGLFVKRYKWILISARSRSQSSMACTLSPVQSKFCSSQSADLARGRIESKIMIETCNIVMLLGLTADKDQLGSYQKLWL